MKKLFLFSLATIAVMVCLPSFAQDITIKGSLVMNRYDDGEQLKLKYLAWNENLGRAISTSDLGVWSMTWDGLELSNPVKDPNYPVSSFYSGGQFTDDEKALLVNNTIMMSGTSGAAYVDGKIVTVFSRDEQSTGDEDLFCVCKWDANTLELLSNDLMNKNQNLESAGMAYNPKDGKVYGFFHFTDTPLNSAITADPEYFTDEDDQDFGREGLDDGYALASVDLKTMTVTQITPGLYYGNYVGFAINADGRAFALTSGGTSAPASEDGRLRDINNELTGAHLYEIDLHTGLMLTEDKEVLDEETGEIITEKISTIPNATGYAFQTHRQAACFDKNNPNIMYFVGDYNCGKGINGNGSWSTLDNREWRTNGLYDTALYSIDINTGIGTRLSKIKNRARFSCIWIEGADNSDGSGMDITGIREITNTANKAKTTGTYNLNGQRVDANYRGVVIENNKKFFKK